MQNDLNEGCDLERPIVAVTALHEHREAIPFQTLSSNTGRVEERFDVTKPAASFELQQRRWRSEEQETSHFWEI